MAGVKPAVLIFICFMLLHAFAAALNCTSPTPESLFGALEKNLFPKNLLRPVKSFSIPINITIGITVGAIIGVDEKSQTITTFIWQVLEWDIEGLSWDEEECGTKRVSVPREQLWVPDVQIAEFMEEDESPKAPYVYLYNTGHVFDNKPIRVVSSCRLVIYTFPFDVQNCSLTFGSYLHYATDIRMIAGTTSEEILEESQNVLDTNGEWELTSISVVPSTLELEEESYSEIKYYIILRRRPLLYVVNLLIPSCFLVTVDLFSFLLPPQSVDRSSFKMTLILGYTVFLLTMNDVLPITGETTPLINVFLFISLALMVASLLETVFITNIQYSSSQHRCGAQLAQCPCATISSCCCLSPSKDTEQPKNCLPQPICYRYITIFPEPAKSLSITNISAIHLQRVSGDTPPEKLPPTPPEPALDELRKLSRDLIAIRLQMDEHFQGGKTLQEWQMIGIVIDRLLFGLYIALIVVSFITIVCIWIWSNSNAA